MIVLGAPADRLDWGRRLGADVTIDITATTHENASSVSSISPLAVAPMS